MPLTINSDFITSLFLFTVPSYLPYFKIVPLYKETGALPQFISLQDPYFLAVRCFPRIKSRRNIGPILSTN